MIRIILYGDPRTKKNNARIYGRKLLPSKAFCDYEGECLYQLLPVREKIDYPVNLKAVYYMQTRRKVDLVNLLEGTCDILVKAGILEDDNSKIVASHDGSRVRYDKSDPRVEVELERIRDD